MIVTGCSQKPSESDGREFLESYVRKQLDGYQDTIDVKVVNFKKTDGLSEIEDGAKHYTMEYQADVIFPRGNSHWGSGYKAGEGYRERGRLQFVKFEEGWRLVDQRAYESHHLPENGSQ